MSTSLRTFLPCQGGQTGGAKWCWLRRQFNDEKGFGFVIPSEGGDGEDIFCHRSEIIGAADRPILMRDQVREEKFITQLIRKFSMMMIMI